MLLSKPIDTILQLIDARARGDVTTALACYEPSATVVMEPGKFASGIAAIKGFIEATMGLAITFGEREFVEAGDLALHISQWTLRASDGAEFSGLTTDVLRRAPDGSWRLALDNPWGSSLLDRQA